MKKRIIAGTLATMMLASALTACGGSSSSASTVSSGGETVSAQTTDADFDTSEYVELKIFAIANAPSNQEWYKEFYEKVNAILKEKLNCTIKVDYAAGNDSKNNYELVLASGEPYDLIHAGNWFGYAVPANKGAYMDLTELFPKYAPDLYAKMPEERLEEAMVNGKVYGIPNLYTSYGDTEIIYREDLRVKYNLPEITDLDSIGAYLQGIKDNEPGLIPCDDFGAGCYGNIFMKTTKYQGIDAQSESHYNFVIDPENPRKVLFVAEVPEYKEFMYRMKEWADAGYWPSSCLANTEWGPVSVQNGKSALSFNDIWPSYDWHPVTIEREHPDWEIKFFDASRLNEDGVVYPRSSTTDMFAITRNAEHAERALMLLNLIATDQDLYTLLRYGLKDKNYELTEDGKIDTSNIDAATETYNYFPANPVKNAEYELIPADRWDEWDDHNNYLAERAGANILSGFALDTSKMEAAYTALNQVRIEYGLPMQAGLVDDVDAAYDDFIKRSYAAGMEECRAEVERQINEFFDANGRA